MTGFDDPPEVDPDRGSVIVGAGVVLSDVKAAAAEHGLLYAPDPTSEWECSVGGTVLTDASGADPEVRVDPTLCSTDLGGARDR